MLYVPAATVHLISVLVFNLHDHLTTHFDASSCWITSPSGTMIACGKVAGHHHLYHLSLSQATMEHHTLIISSNLPTLETWHKHLGHTNYRTILDMAHSHAVSGMPLDLLLEPPTCEHCILGKQVCTHVPTVWEGLRATRQLELVHIDLIDPMSVMSCSGYLYSMNINDNFTGYPWTIHLKSKSDGFSHLTAWELSIEVQTRKHIGIYVTDNGKLKSTTMCKWYESQGTTHQFMAPHVSAQNGKHDCLHLTLMNKAHSMLITCGAPPSFWDEFLSTAAYLSTLTPSSSLHNHTPYKLWFGRKPDISHLHKIGCQTYICYEVDALFLFSFSFPLSFPLHLHLQGPFATPSST